ncbi:MAG: HNH endonuclease signature motif containing protein [Planctomycetota bacterium]
MEQKIKAMDLKNLIESQGYRCALTGVELEPSTASADHIQPVSGGGRNEIDHIQIVHHKVNAAKGTMANDEFIQMCKNVVEWVTGGRQAEQARHCLS